MGLVVTTLISGPAIASEEAEYAAQARSLMKEFGQELKQTLTHAMKSGGPIAALESCNTKAPVMAQEAMSNSSWSIGRTSLKIRSAVNKPDAWEQQVLEDFEARKLAGEDPKKMEFFETITLDGKPSFRYMKAIPTGKACLNCHAAEIKPEIAKKIQMLYPNDQARGFEIGDIRGAFTLRKTL